MAITYNGKEFTRFKAKSGGKNQSKIDGFYCDAADTERYFIKKPADQRELFAEAFAGAILQEIMDRGLIDKIYNPSLIVASVVRVDEGKGKPEYALIQPMVSFVELYKTIKTGYADGSDRDPLKEAYAGPDYYRSVLELQQFGLTTALMFSMWLSAHSVHSGNIVTLNNEKMMSKQQARLDWGDAFRFLAHPQNNDNLLYAYENRGLLNLKRLTKDYFLNYKKIPGLFPAMAEKGRLFKAALQEGELVDILQCALKKLPADLIDQQTKDEFAEYANMDSFRTVQLGPHSNGGQFIPEMAKVLHNRLEKITELQDVSLQSAMGEMYKSFCVAIPPCLQMDEELPFPDLMSTWDGLLGDVGVESVDTDDLRLAQLAQRFNDYLNTVAEDAEQLNIWQHAPEDGNNFFTTFNQDNTRAALRGHAYIAHYKESVIFRHLSFVDPKTLGMLRFAPYEEPSAHYSRQYPDSPWAKLQRLATAGQNIILQLRLIQNGKMLADDFMQENLPVLQKALRDFLQYKTEVDALLASDAAFRPVSSSESSFFYDIDEHALSVMSGDQLATLCLEELNAPHPSRLIMRILKNDRLWHEVDGSLSSDVFQGREDNLVEKKNKIYQWRQLVHMTTIMQLENEAQLNQGFAQQLTEKDERFELAQQQAKTQQAAAEFTSNQLTLQLGKLTQQVKENSEQHEQLLAHLREQLQSSEDLRLSAETKIARLQLELSDLDTRLQEQTTSTQEEQLRLKQEFAEQHKQTQDTATAEIDLLNEHVVQKEEEIQQLKQELAEQKTYYTEQIAKIKESGLTPDALQQLIAEQIAAQKKYEDALAEKQNIQFARTLQMVPVVKRINALEKKARDLGIRHEVVAFNAANTLVTEMRKVLRAYIDSEKSEHDALTDFKAQTPLLIDAAEKDLGEHRKKWKYVLANLSLAVLTAGVGYLAAMVVNKLVYKRFTFFSETDSQAKLKELEHDISTTRPGPAASA